MVRVRSSSLLAALSLLAGCVDTTIADHAMTTPPTDASANTNANANAKTLLVIETALGTDDPAANVHAAQASREIVAEMPGAILAAPAPEAALLASARAQGCARIVVLRVEDYAVHGAVRVGLALPPLSWESYAVVSLRWRALDATTGEVLADLRRDRRSGGAFALGREARLPQELSAVVQGLNATQAGI